MAAPSILAVGIRIIEGAGFDVPVVFAPNSMELKRAWLCITMKPLSSPGNNSSFSAAVMRWVHVSYCLLQRLDLTLIVVSDKFCRHSVKLISFCISYKQAGFCVACHCKSDEE